jgi:hypothetical protein
LKKIEDKINFILEKSKTKFIYRKIKIFFLKSRCFMTAFGITALILILISGFVVAEKNIKTYGFDDKKPFFEYKLKDEDKFIKFVFMGRETKLFFENKKLGLRICSNSL